MLRPLPKDTYLVNIDETETRFPVPGESKVNALENGCSRLSRL